jgi:hydroxyquinol 1,2-dioxygenase
LRYFIEAEGYETLTTHVFRRNDKYSNSDVVFGMRESLIADWQQTPDGTYLLEYDFVLNPKRV